MMLFSSLELESEPRALKWVLSFVRGYLELGMHAAAKRELDRLSVRHRCHPEIIEMRVRVLLARARYEQAAWLARSASKVYPGIAEFYMLAGEAYETLNRPEQAKEVWVSAPALFHVSGVFHYNLARYEALMGNNSTAREHMALAIELDPSNKERAKSDPRLRDLLSDGTH
ncbi:MAG TPA: hypothetical protein VGA56_24920 [Opitutaceae bacterium]